MTGNRGQTAALGLAAGKHVMHDGLFANTLATLERGLHSCWKFCQAGKDPDKILGGPGGV